jgi:hypothetical protein
MGRGVGNVFFFKQNLSGTGPDFAGYNIDKRGLSGTVGANNRG